MGMRWWVALVVGGVVACGPSNPSDWSRFQFHGAPPPASPAPAAPDAGTVGPSCEPLSCEKAQATCGELSDGCGGTLSCGGCAQGQTCGGGGLANQCGSPPISSAPPTKVVVRAPGIGELGHAAITHDAEGNLFLASWGGDARVSKNTIDGARIWGANDAPLSPEIPSASIYEGVAVAPDTGEVYVWGSCTSSGPCGSVLEKFAPDGQSYTLLAKGSDEMGYGPNVFDLEGTRLSRLSAHDSVLTWTRPDGSVLEVRGREQQSEPTGLDFDDGFTFVGGGRAVVTAQVKGPTVFQGASFSGTDAGAVLELGEDGALIWALPITAGTAKFWDVGRAADGALFVAGSFAGTVQLDGHTVEGGVSPRAVVIALGPDGKPRWEQVLPFGWRFRMAVNPASGRVAVAGLAPGNGCDRLVIEELEPTGQVLWSRSIAPDRCIGRVHLGGLTYAKDRLVVVGGFVGAADLGEGLVQSSGEGDGFLIEVGE